MDIFDISLSLSPDMTVYPGDPPFRREVTVSPATGKPYTLSDLGMGSHTGTHVDAPAHFIPGGMTVDQLAPDRLCGPCRVIDLPGNESIRRLDIERMGLDGCERVLFKTENSARLGTTGYFVNAVTFDIDAAELLAGYRPVLVGLDFMTVDAPGRETFDAHLALLENDCIILEGIDLRKVNPGEYELWCAPLKVKGGDGAPARAFLCR